MAHPSRNLLSLLCATALAGFAPGVAVACTEGAGTPPTLLCDGPSGPVASTLDGLAVTVTPEGVVSSDNRDTPPFALGGTGQSVANEGTIRNTDTRNNTNAIQGTGDGLQVDNSGLIESGDRAVHVLGGAADFSLINREDGVIRSRRQAVRTEVETASRNGFVENFGLIESSNGRAVQMRGTGSTVINHGTLIGGEEVIEGRLDFTVENHGLIAIRGLSWDPVTRTWTDSGAPTDEDGVQFSSGRIDNWGVILSTDDGIDIDEGIVHNHATGVIISAAPDSVRDSGGIDIDPVLQIPGVPDAEHPPAGALTIINEGYIEGPRAIVADLDSIAPLDITNAGTLVGRSGVAIDLAPGQGDTTITLRDGSVIDGDILFGAGGLNTLVLGPFADGARMSGTVGAREDAGFDLAFGTGFALEDFRAYLLRGDRFDLHLAAGTGTIGFALFGVNAVAFDGQSFTAQGFADFLGAGGVSVIPLPAAGWLLLGGLGALAALHRRRRAA